MHEYSIVQALIDQCEVYAKNESGSITKVFVKIGVMSGVEPDLLQNAFNVFKDNTVCQNAQLQLDLQELIIFCDHCKREFELKKREYCCPECQSINIDIIDGEEMYLMRLELE